VELARASGEPERVMLSGPSWTARVRGPLLGVEADVTLSGRLHVLGAGAVARGG
jgi:hypothetical protein